MIQLIYNDVDVTESVSINRCWHDMYAAGKSDTLFLRLNDSDKLWDSWSPKIGDKIKVQYETISTGTMFVTSATPKNGVYEIEAQASPVSGFEKRFKAWQRVRFLQLAEEIAEQNGLSFASYGVDDALYGYVLQDGESDFAFLSRRASLEGCAVSIYDKKLVLYSERAIEAQDAIDVLEIAEGGDFRCNDNSAELYGSCIVENGDYVGTFSADNGSTRILRPQNFGNVGSNEEAERFAMNLLRLKNKDCFTGYFYAGILSGYAAASVVELYNEQAPSWNGKAFLHHIRNDYGKGTSKIFFRRPLEGY